MNNMSIKTPTFNPPLTQLGSITNSFYNCDFNNCDDVTLGNIRLRRCVVNHSPKMDVQIFEIVVGGEVVGTLLVSKNSSQLKFVHTPTEVLEILLDDPWFSLVLQIMRGIGNAHKNNSG